MVQLDDLRRYRSLSVWRIIRMSPKRRVPSLACGRLTENPPQLPWRLNGEVSDSQIIGLKPNAGPPHGNAEHAHKRYSREVCPPTREGWAQGCDLPSVR